MKKLLRWILLSALAAVVLCGVCSAENTQPAPLYNDFTWQLTDGGATLVISGSGELNLNYFHYSAAPWKNDRDDITKVVFDPGITYLGNLELGSLNHLQTVVLPNTLRVLGSKALLCSATQADLPDSLTTIGYLGYTAAQDSPLRLPASVTDINLSGFPHYRFDVDEENPRYASADGVLYDKTDAKLLLFPSGREGSYTTPAFLTAIGDYAFEDSALTSVTVSEGVTDIGDRAFYYSTQLTSVSLPASLAHLGESVFVCCNQLAAVTVAQGSAHFFTQDNILYERLPEGGLALFLVPNTFSGECTVADGVVRIGDQAFGGITGITAVHFPASLRTVGDGAFSSCAKLKTVTFQPGVTQLGANCFYGCTALTSIALPDTVVTLGRLAFDRCQSLTSATLSANLKTLENGVFAQCFALKSITIPEGVRVIEVNAFSSCPALTQVSIPGSVETIQKYAFRYCSGLMSLTLHEGIRSIEKQAFEGAALTQVSIPASMEALSGDAFPRETVLTFSQPEPGEPLPVSDRTSPLRSDNRYANIYDGDWYDGAPYGSVVKSLLTWQDGYYYRLEHTGDCSVLEKYDQNFRYLQSWEIPDELYLFGGFYAGSDGWYFAYGRTNYGCDDSAEVLRVVKYDKNLRRVKSCSLYGGNTVQPFSAGSLRMDQQGEMLMLRTCHDMYPVGGAIHQASLNMVIQSTGMVLMYEQCQVQNISYGYVSHSFNQFVKGNGQYMVSADHGDAVPRSIVLLRRSMDYLNADYGSIDANILPIGGEDGDNTTFASLGGLALSPTHFLVVGDTADQSSFDVLSAGCARNVFLGVVTNDDSRPLNCELKYLTHYTDESDRWATTPAIVTVDDDLFLILWADKVREKGEITFSGLINYVYCDGQGRVLGGVRSMPGELSDCAPILAGDRVVWYVTHGSEPKFYSIPAARPGAVSVLSLSHTGGGTQIALEDTANVLSGGAQIIAARKANGKMLSAASGVLGEDNVVRFTKPLDGEGWTLYLLRPGKTLAPLTAPLPVT